MEHKVLIEHIRRGGNKRYRITATGKRFKGVKGGNPIGSMAAVFDETEKKVAVGWSLCNKLDKCRDGINASRAVDIALGRALAERSATPVPKSIAKKVKQFAERAKRYYKTENIVIVGQAA
jgi:hypothetical protein